ncbi:transposase family protein, partial [Acidocella aminolytica]|uniref:transposase family protein n=1 Tax=Acidocella aminolytica TaxID=33998 RepID=UPI0009152A55
MHGRFQRANLAPDGFVVVSVQNVGESVEILLRARHGSGTCPDCGRRSHRIQSRYIRRPLDLPLGGRRAVLAIMARRFWCDTAV